MEVEVDPSEAPAVEPSPDRKPVASEPVASAPAASPAGVSPLPPRRSKSVAVTPAKAQPQAAPAASATKPQASRAKPDRQASASGFIRSASYVGPRPGGFAQN